MSPAPSSVPPDVLPPRFRRAFLVAAVLAMVGALLLDADRPGPVLAAVGAAALPLTVAAALVQVGAWALQTTTRGLPLAAFAALVAASDGWLILVGRDGLAPTLLALLALWASLHGDRRGVAVGTALALAPLAVAALVYGDAADTLSRVLGVLAGVAGGRLSRTHLRVQAELRAAQAALVRRAEADERRRVAREVHDIVAHSLTVTLLHLGGARRLLERDPGEAGRALALAETAGRESLRELRRTVGLLGPQEGETDPNGPEALPTLADVPTLVAGLRAAGADVEARVEGDPQAVSASLGLDAYRVLQEALTNATRHAPGRPVRAEVGVRPGEVRLVVRNPLPAGPPVASAGSLGGGHGLAGLRERARLRGGRAFAGPDGPEWVVDVRLPAAPAEEAVWTA